MMEVEYPDQCTAAVYDPADRQITLRSFPLRDLRDGEALVRIDLAAICGSDLHTIQGRRDPGGPLILGHEMIGTVVACGGNGCRDAAGDALTPGQRVTWALVTRCGTCFYCTRGIPQKCLNRLKYGHELLTTDPPLTGAFAEYVYLVPGTAIYPISDSLRDSDVVFANCSLATMCAGVRMLDISAGETVLVQGAGMVGLCAVALCASRGARVCVTDVDDSRLARAVEFGAAATLNAADGATADVMGIGHEWSGGHGFDAAIEACGRSEVLAQGIAALRIGGRYLWAGCVAPGADVTLDAYDVITRMLRIQGLHNYTPSDLATALDFLAGRGREHPFSGVVGARFPLSQINEAVCYVLEHRDCLRVAIEPGG